MRSTPASASRLLLRCCALIGLSCCCVQAAGYGRAPISVAAVDSGVRVQHGNGTSADLLAGAAVASDDIIQTPSGARVRLRFGTSGELVVGGGSKVLLGMNASGGRRGRLTGVALTLFGGAAYVRVEPACSAGVFTPAAVARVPTGALTAVVDATTGECGFQALAGDSIEVRGVAFQKGIHLAAGQATVVAPGADASPPSAVTRLHADVLAHFFGDSCAAAWLTRAAVVPRGDEAAGGRSVPGEREMMGQAEAQRRSGPGTYRRLFRLNDIYGSLQDDEDRRTRRFAPAEQTGPLFAASHFSLGLQGGAAVDGAGAARGQVTLTPGVRWRFLDAALRLSLAQNHASWGVHSFTDGPAGALDLIDHVTIGHPADSLAVTLGPLRDYTIGDGIVVRHFANRDLYSLFQPLALYGTADVGHIVCFDGFVADVSDWSVGGLRAFYHSLGYYAGLGFYYDANQYHTPASNEASRFVAALPDSVPSATRDVDILEVDAGLDLADNPGFGMRIDGNLAYRFRTISTTNGYVVRLPLTVEVPRVRMGLAYVGEAGELTEGYFSWLYPSDRCRVSLSGGTQRPVAQSDVLSRGRSAYGLEAWAGVSPLRGLALQVEYRQDLRTRNAFADTAIHTRDNFQFYASLCANDSLWRWIKVARAYVGDVGGSISPPGASLSTSWGLRAGVYLLSAPLLWNVALEAGLEYYRLDLDPLFDNHAGATDHVLEFFAGLRWGFL